MSDFPAVNQIKNSIKNKFLAGFEPIDVSSSKTHGRFWRYDQ